jgi:hypothetical protein
VYVDSVLDAYDLVARRTVYTRVSTAATIAGVVTGIVAGVIVAGIAPGVVTANKLVRLGLPHHGAARLGRSIRGKRVDREVIEIQVQLRHNERS